jgi:hypothetical protein
MLLKLSNKKIIAAIRITDSKTILTFEAEIKGKDLNFLIQRKFLLKWC